MIKVTLSEQEMKELEELRNTTRECILNGEYTDSYIMGVYNGIGTVLSVLQNRDALLLGVKDENLLH